MDTRVGPVEHSQMDPTEGSSEGGTQRPTVPWRPCARADMTARVTALKQLGIEDRFEFADHAKIYNAEHGRFHSAGPIEMVSVPTGYILPPSSSYSTPSQTPEILAWKLSAEERARAEDMLRAEQHFQRVRGDKLEQAGRGNDGLRLLRAKAVLGDSSPPLVVIEF